MADSNTQIVTIGSASLHITQSGTGDPLLLIHGSLDGMQSFRRQVPYFAEHYRVVTYARRHHPPSEDPDTSHGYRLETHVEDLIALMDALGIDSAHMVGSSYGGYVALTLALRSPRRLRSLVLCEPPILPFLERTSEGSRELERFVRDALKPAREAFGRGDLRGGVGHFVDGIRGMPGAFKALPESSQNELLRFGPELEMELTTEPEEFMPDIPCSDLRQLSIPVLLVTGERSPRMFHLIIRELAHCLKQSQELEISGAGHAMHVMNPRAYTHEVLAFLARAS